MVINAQNKEKYLEDLKNWLCELERAPLEEMGAFFRKRLPEYEARMTKFWGEDYKQFARAVPQSAKRILDLGCGTGLELDALYNLRTDISVIGIDLSPDMLDALMKKHGDKDLTLLCGSYFAVPFPGAFDAVISFESLHHFLPEKKRRVTQLLSGIYPKEAGDFTQALMELGATVCGPNRAPDCEHCPCKGMCLGFQRDTAASLPVKSPKKARRQEDRTVFILSCDGCFALEKRPETGLLAGLWQFPNVSGRLDTQDALDAVSAMGLHPREILRETEKTHIFTHIQWNMKGIYLEVDACGGSFQWLTEKEINLQAALPTAFRQFWER